MPDKPWKAEEREVRRRIGVKGWRTPHGADADTECFSYEIKARRSIPQWLVDAVDEARMHAGFRTPVTVLSWRRQGVKTRRFVILDFEEWLAWHGPGPTPVGE